MQAKGQGKAPAQDGEPIPTTASGTGTPDAPTEEGATPDARLLARGVCRLLTALGYASLTEFTLRSGRRADVMAIEPGGQTLIVEIKSSIEDFRSDHKWPEYRDFCDLFYFAVPQGFPLELIPEDCGLMVADAYEATILRHAPQDKINAARRKSLTLRFGWTAAQRLTQLLDPDPP